MASTLMKNSAAKKVDLGTKVIFKYTSTDKNLEVNHMKISGRHPENPAHFVYEDTVHFMLYVLKGTGKVYCEDEIYEVEIGDVVDVPAKTRFAVDGKELEYLAVQTPAWTPKQAYIVDTEGNVVEQTTI